jgi:lycopene cyclase domain-containing protein
MDKQLTYLLINILTCFFPVVLSFDKKVHFYQKWKFIFPGLLISGALYLIWDYIFTIQNVWSFNPSYILGIKFFDLPLEEILFFITVPFACIFIYECLKVYFNPKITQEISRGITYILIIACIILLFFFYDRLYSFINFSTLLIILIYTLVKPIKLNMGQFYLAYLVSLVPFYIVNGILTSIPIVLYNNTENMGLRVGSIPFEDHFYSMSLILLNLIFFEYFRSRNKIDARTY